MFLLPTEMATVVLQIMVNIATFVLMAAARKNVQLTGIRG